MATVTRAATAPALANAPHPNRGRVIREKVTIEVPLLRWLAVRLSKVAATAHVLPEELVAIAVGRMLALGDDELLAMLRNKDEGE